MKKYTTPELNVTRFDVEDVITASTGSVYVAGTGEGEVAVAQTVDFNDIF